MTWGWTVIGLGAWESLAFSTSRVPTISATIHVAHTRYPRRTRAGILIWSVALAHHLLTYQAK